MCDWQFFRISSHVALNIPSVKFLKIKPLIVGMVKLVTSISKGKERLQIKNTVGGTHDNLDVFPQLMDNSSSTILH